MQQFSVSILARATDNFSDLRLIGKGGFAKVYRGHLFGTAVAIKQLTEVVLFLVYSHSSYIARATGWSYGSC